MAIPGRVAKFRINPGLWNPYKPGFGHYFNVHVFNTQEDMHSYALRISSHERLRSDSEVADWLGLVVPSYRVSRDNVISPKVGDILLWQERLGVGLVSHEAVHAATSFLRIMGNLRLGNQIDHDEESLAYTIGSVTKQIYSKLYSLKVIV
jgi:hypothetical protein